MNIGYATLETCSSAAGTAVVIDVWRSFTTTAFAFAAGAREIITVASVEEALALRERFPDVLLMGRGELGGSAAEGFDFGNSPTVLTGCDLRNRRIIQCTPNGTRGIVQSVNAETLLAASFVCAGATARYIKQRSPITVTLVSTQPEEGDSRAREDQDCAEYIAALLRNETPDGMATLNRIRDVASRDFHALVFQGIWTEAKRAVLESDLDCCLTLDRFDFAMVVQRREGLLVMEPVPV
jgi:2-phosphosulfolactate phosphatase